MKRSREVVDHDEPRQSKQPKYDVGTTTAECLARDPTYSLVGSYLVIIEDDDGDMEFHICTDETSISVYDGQYNLLLTDRPPDHSSFDTPL